MNKNSISIIGDGGWGTTLAILLSKKGFGVTVWGAFPDYLARMDKDRENAKFLPGFKIPKEIVFTSSLSDAIKVSEIIVLAVPSQFMRSVLAKIPKALCKGKCFVSVTKGIENGTLKRMSEVVKDVLGDVSLVVLSGPTIAHEVARNNPTTAVSSCNDVALAKLVQDIFITEHFRVYTNTDVIGVEVGGSIKNVIAIAAGASDALGFGANAKAALLTRGLVEIVRLGSAMGARKETFYGLSGLGDLATTCISQHSRNKWLGEQIGIGRKLSDILKETEMVVEGIATAKSAHELSKRYNVDMPITNEIYKVLYEEKESKKAVFDLMTRAPKGEEIC